MESSTGGRDEDHKPELISGTSPAPPQRTLRNTSHAHRASVIEEMLMIPESEEATFPNTTNISNGETSLLRQPEPEPTQPRSSPSLLRRITTRLTHSKSSGSGAPPPIPLTPFKSLKKPRHPGYENLEDADDDHDNVPVDLSILSGLGFEVTEAGQTINEPEPWLEQDTAYQSSHIESAKPDFQSFVRRRQLGDGLVVGVKLKRDPSIHQDAAPTAMEEEVKRSKTVRHAAQNYAKERNMIVAVSEPVDLSFFEGHAPHLRSSQSFETMLSRTGTMVETPESYFFPQDPDVPSWRPLTMSTPYILFLTAGAFALAGCQEYLCQKSQRLAKLKSGILHFDDVSKVSVGVFFVWKYLPTMVTIIYAVLFSVMDFDIRRLEPFYQLSQPQGSPASESLNVDHLTMFQYFVPFKAFRLGQWTVFLSTIGNIIASTASPALQNPSVNFEPNPACGTTLNGTLLPCPEGASKYVVLIDPVWSRLLTASYLIIGFIATVLFFQLRRKTGLLSDPKGIAGIASMATKSHILREFEKTDFATRRDIQKRLEHRRFILYKSSIWQGQWNLNNEPEQESARSLASPHPPMLRLSAGIPFIAAQVFCLVAVPLISLTRANVIPNKVPWLPILVATVLKLVWSTFEADVRLMEPFYRLSLGNASPENSLTLDYQATVYGFLPFKAAFNGHWLLCIVGLCSMALDVLSVTVSSFSVQADIFYDAPRGEGRDESNGDETWRSFWVSVFLSVAILVFTIFTTSIVYWRRRHPFLPREPSTIASVLAFIYASKMLEDFIDTERLTNKQMEQRLKKLNKTYALGWFKGRDDKLHIAIDQEPMRSRYVHGERYDQAVTGPVEGYYV